MNRTLGEIRADIQVRLGFGAAGQAGVVNAPIIDSFIKSADEQLYWQCNWRHLIASTTRTAGIQQLWYDYPQDANPSRLLGIAVQDGGEWLPLAEGISWGNRSDDTPGIPRRFDAKAQIELWPASEAQRPLRFDYVMAYKRMVEDNDRPMCDSQMVFLQALVNAKLHYRQPDGQVYADQMRALLDLEMSGQRRQSVFSRNDNDSCSYSAPKVIYGDHHV